MLTIQQTHECYGQRYRQAQTKMSNPENPLEWRTATLLDRYGARYLAVATKV